MHIKKNEEFKRQLQSQQLSREHKIVSKKSVLNDREEYPKTHHSLSALCQRPCQKDSTGM